MGDFKGVWIPKDIWLSSELTMLEKVIYIEIDSLDNENHCTASNAYLAEFCNCSESKITKAISKLQELGMLEIMGFDGRHRIMRVVKSTRQGSKKYEAEPYKVRANNIDNTIDSKVSISKDIDTRDSAEPNVSPFKLSTKKLATKPNLYTSCINLIDDFVSKNRCLKIRQLLIDHLDIMCESDKLHGKKQYEGILKKLYEYGNKNNKYRQIIEYSIEHGYATFYPLDEYKPINRKECPEVISNPHKVERFDDTDEKVMNRFTKQLKKEGKLNEF